MASKINTAIFKDELGAILEEMIGIEISSEEEIDNLAYMFYKVNQVVNHPESAILINSHERYIVLDFFL